jgi:hypothetical protein
MTTNHASLLDAQAMIAKCRELLGGAPVSLTTTGPGHYRRGSIDGVQIMAHRVVWALHFGEWPAGIIDHIDGDPTNNRVENLRVTEHTLNLRNAHMPSTNTSGRVGVYWRKDMGMWWARIGVGGKMKNLGHFDSFDAAVAVRKAAERQYGYTERHGQKKAAA